MWTEPWEEGILKKIAAMSNNELHAAIKEFINRECICSQCVSAKDKWEINKVCAEFEKRLRETGFLK